VEPRKEEEEEEEEEAISLGFLRVPQDGVDISWG
jgi:F0F1-type ATP synthase epsilon subunit